MRRVFLCAFFPLALFLAASCARPALPEDLPALERHWPARDQVFRHKIRVDFPGRETPFSCDGLLRLSEEAGAPSARVVCLGPFGLTLCDMTVTPAGYAVAFLHPSLAGVPHVAEHIALCVRSVWFAALPPTSEALAALPVREFYASTVLEHAFGQDGGRIVKGLGPKYFWTVAFTPAEPQPPLIVFRNDREGYVVHIRFIAGHGTGDPQS